MSGLEVIGGISATITVLEAIKKVYEGARNSLPLSETFEVAGKRLPVLLHILQSCKASLRPFSDSLSSEVYQALKKITSDCEQKARVLSEIFNAVVSGPMEDGSWRDRYSKIVRKLGQRNKVNFLMTAITQDVQLLINNEALRSMTPNYNGKLEGILVEVKDLHDSILHEEKTTQNFDNSEVQNNNVNSGNGNIHTGSGPQINNHGRIGVQKFSFANMMSNDNFDFRGPRGICLDQAPSMPSGLFIDREVEQAAIRKTLHPFNEKGQRKQHQQRRLAVAGIGGIGKTQTTLTYAQTPDPLYETVFWLNATTEASLTASFATAAGIIFGAHVSRSLDEKEAVRRTREWLSHPKNSKWLLVFDNYDNPSDFKLDPYYPPAAHGAVIITTRRADLVAGATELLDMKPLNRDDSLMILQTLSKRENIGLDPWAVQLAERLAGLPLALATAGAYLQKSPFDFKRYLQEYEERWNIDPRRPTKLQEYQERTLYTTWDMSYNRLRKDDPEAATLLRMFGYLDNHSLWYGLLRSGISQGCPLYEVIDDEVSFNGAMTALSEHAFLEFHPDLGYWSMHNCVHDWTSAQLNKTIDSQLYWYAFDCVAHSIGIGENDIESLEHLFYSRYVPHAARLSQHRFLKTAIMTTITTERLAAAQRISNMLAFQGEYSAAERLYKARLVQSQAAHGPGDLLTLKVMNDLGYLYLRQKRIPEAKDLLGRALTGKEKILQLNDLSLWTTRMNLGHIHTSEENYDAAFQLYLQALFGGDMPLFGRDMTVQESMSHLLCLLATMENEVCKHDRQASADIRLVWVLSKKDGETRIRHVPLGEPLIDVMDSLGMVLSHMGHKDKAEQLLKRTLMMRERIQGPAHPSTIQAVRNLGLNCELQGKLDDAEKLFTRALTEREKLFGPSHYSTILVLQDLGRVYSEQKRFLDAESAYIRVLSGLEKAFEPQHEVALNISLELVSLYNQQSQVVKAGRMYKRALAMREMLLGKSNMLSPDTAARLGLQCMIMGHFDEAERTYLQILGHPAVQRLWEQRSLNTTTLSQILRGYTPLPIGRTKQNDFFRIP